MSVAERVPVDVARALAAAAALPAGQERARVLVDAACDADVVTSEGLLRAVAGLREEWRGRTLFSTLRQMRSSVLRNLSPNAQDTVVAIVSGLTTEARRISTLLQLPSGLPPPLTSRLDALAVRLSADLSRLRVRLHLHRPLSADMAVELVDQAGEVGDEELRAQALAVLAPALPLPAVNAAYRAALAIGDVDGRVLALTRVVACFPDDRRAAAQEELLALCPRVKNGLRRFGCLASLDALHGKRDAIAHQLFDLARRLDPADVRCRAMWTTASYTDNPALAERAVLAGLASAECVSEERRRTELLLLLQPYATRLTLATRRELPRVVHRFEDPGIRSELESSQLARFFVYDRPVNTGAIQWDLFVSYSTRDLKHARSFAAEVRSRGMRVFLAADDLDAELGSGDWAEAVDIAEAASRTMVVLVTASALKSPHVKHEWKTRASQTARGGSNRLFTIRLGGPKVGAWPRMLQRFQCLDASNGLERGHFVRVLDIVGAG